MAALSRIIAFTGFFILASSFACRGRRRLLHRRSGPRPHTSQRLPFRCLSGGLHCSRRRASSSSATSRVSVRLGISMLIMSPASTKAQGPPSKASGEMWPMSGPAGGAGKAPIDHQGHAFAELHAHQDGGEHMHLPHPGPSLGAFVADDDHVPGCTRSDIKPATASSMESKGLAGPGGPSSWARPRTA